MRGQRPRRCRHRALPGRGHALYLRQSRNIATRYAREPPRRADAMGYAERPRARNRWCDPSMRGQLTGHSAAGGATGYARHRHASVRSGACRGCPPRPRNGLAVGRATIYAPRPGQPGATEYARCPRRTRLESARSAATVYAGARRVMLCQSVRSGWGSGARPVMREAPVVVASSASPTSPLAATGYACTTTDLTSVNTHRDHLCVDNTPSASQMFPVRRVQPNDGLRPCHRGG